jgi:hypothetical protein
MVHLHLVKDSARTTVIVTTWPRFLPAISREMSKHESANAGYEPNKRRRGEIDEKVAGLIGSIEAKRSLSRIRGLIEQIESTLPSHAKFNSQWILKKLECLMAQAQAIEEVSDGVKTIIKYLAEHEQCYWDNGNSSEIQDIRASCSRF